MRCELCFHEYKKKDMGKGLTWVQVDESYALCHDECIDDAELEAQGDTK